MDKEGGVGVGLFCSCQCGPQVGRVRPEPLSLLPLLPTSLHTHAPASLYLHDLRPKLKVTSSGEPSWIEPCWSTCHVHLPVCLHSPDSDPTVCPAPAPHLGPGIEEGL